MQRRQIRVSEYRVVTVPVSPADAAVLTALRPRPFSVEVLPGGFARLMADSVVGRVVTPSLDICIEPKLAVLGNVVALLGLVATGSLGLCQGLHRLLPQVAGFTQVEDVSNWLAVQLLERVEALARRGWLRSYVERTGDLAVVRGRLDLHRDRTRRNHLPPRRRVACVWQEYDPDRPEVVALRAAVEAVALSPVFSANLRRRAAALLTAFLGVPRRPVRPRDIDRIRLDRLAASYAPALALARLILSHCGHTHQTGETGSGSFLVDMNALFERAVQTTALAWARRHGLPAPRLQPAYRLGRYEYGDETPSNGLHVYPDLLLLLPGADVIVDAKYREAGAPGRDEAFQMLAYMVVTGLRRAVLVRPKPAGAPTGCTTLLLGELGDPPGRVEVAYVDLAGVRATELATAFEGTFDATFGDPALRGLAGVPDRRSQLLNGALGFSFGFG